MQEEDEERLVFREVSERKREKEREGKKDERKRKNRRAEAMW